MEPLSHKRTRQSESLILTSYHDPAHFLSYVKQASRPLCAQFGRRRSLSYILAWFPICVCLTFRRRTRCVLADQNPVSFSAARSGENKSQQLHEKLKGHAQPTIDRKQYDEKKSLGKSSLPKKVRGPNLFLNICRLSSPLFAAAPIVHPVIPASTSSACADVELRTDVHRSGHTHRIRAKGNIHKV